MKKQYLNIYLVYILLGLSLGLWEIFKPLWLIEKGLTIENLGITFCIALIMAAIFSLLIGNKVMKKGIRASIQIALVVRIINFISMLFTSNKYIMILQSCLDLLIDTLVIQWMYPLLTQIKINNTFFGLKDNLYDLASNLGTIVAGIFTGIILYNFTSYQVCITICILLFIICFLLLFKVKNEKTILQENNIIREIFKINSAKDYMKYSCSRRLQLFLILGFFMVILTDNLGIDKSIAGISWAILQIFCNCLGVLVSFWSDKMNRIKFFKWSNISSIFILLIAGVTRNKVFAFISILWIDILSDFYSPIIDAPLTNEIPKNLQLHFANYNHILSYIGRSIAYIIAGYLIGTNYTAIFLVSIPFLVYQNYIGIRALKNCKNTNVYGKKYN
mgnify:CR=1 FL=1